MGQKTPSANQSEILVVEDNPDNLRYLKLMLEKRGYRVRAATEGPLALESVASTLPDLILLDVKMPVMDGYEVCRRLKSSDRSRNVPVIFISALQEIIDKVKGFKAGGVDYITKPFEPEEVFARVETHLQLQKLTYHLEQKVRERTKALTIAKEEAEAASIAKTKFLTKMSHELRTPLNPVLGYAQIMKRQENLTDEQKERLQVICDCCEHLTALISSVLEIARIDMCKWTVENLAFDLQAMIRMVVSDTQRKAGQKNLTIHYEETKPLPESVIGDCRMIRRVLLHLLDNAVKFTDHGEVKLVTSVVQSPMSGGQDPASAGKCRLRFEVADSGIGIPTERFDEIFKPFYQGEIEGRVLEGAGLGLTISRRLIDLLGGHLSVQSPYPQKSEPEGGPGSIFTVELDLGIVQPAQFSEGAK